jgi:hypothetical protein
VRKLFSIIGVVVIATGVHGAAMGRTLEVMYVSADLVYVNGGRAAGINVGDTLWVAGAARTALIVTHASSFTSACRQLTAGVVLHVGDPVDAPTRQANESAPAPRRFIDVHRGQFDDRPSKGRCEACHTQASFVPSTYTVEAHAKTRFPLEGAHLAVPCTACHKEVTDEHGRYRQFVIADVRCVACHSQPPKGDSPRP